MTTQDTSLLKEDMHNECSRPMTVNELKLALAEHVIIGMRTAQWAGELMNEFISNQRRILDLQEQLANANEEIARLSKRCSRAKK